MEIKKLFDLSASYSITQVLLAVCKFDIANHIEIGLTKTIEDLAKELDVDQEALLYLMKASTRHSIFHEIEHSEFPNGSVPRDGVFKHTPMSIALRQQQVRDIAMVKASRFARLAWDGLYDTVKTGHPNIKSLLGEDSVWEYLSKHKEENEVFHRSMSSVTAMSAPLLASNSSFKGFDTVCDIGGGHGFLLEQILQQNPNIKSGINFDIEASKEGNNNISLKDPRLKFEFGNVLTDDIPIADCYTFKSVLHMWTDETVVNVLKKAASKMNDKGAIYIYEINISDEKNEKSDEGHYCLHMLTICNGTERNHQKWKELADRSGLKLKEIQVIKNQLSLEMCKVLLIK